jgi:DNA-binding XRE family transcriptional regulator
MLTDLKVLRATDGLTQFELGKDSGVSRWRISLIESLQVKATQGEESALRIALAKHLTLVATTARRLGDHLSQEAR